MKRKKKPSKSVDPKSVFPFGLLGFADLDTRHKHESESESV